MAHGSRTRSGQPCWLAASESGNVPLRLPGYLGTFSTKGFALLTDCGMGDRIGFAGAGRRPTQTDVQVANARTPTLISPMPSLQIPVQTR
jgi:hypothetical protein